MTEQTKPEVIVEVIAYAASPKDAEGNILKDEKGKNRKGKVLGADKVYQYSTDEKGHTAALKRDGVAAIMENHNRQKKTDCRNNIAAIARQDADPGKILERKIKRVRKAQTDERRAALNTKLAAVLNEFEELEE